MINYSFNVKILSKISHYLSNHWTNISGKKWIVYQVEKRFSVTICIDLIWNRQNSLCLTKISQLSTLSNGQLKNRPIDRKGLLGKSNLAYRAYLYITKKTKCFEHFPRIPGGAPRRSAKALPRDTAQGRQGIRHCGTVVFLFGTSGWLPPLHGANVIKLYISKTK
jgi:hypothetical protein